MNDFVVKLAQWPLHEPLIFSIRRQVFVVEQKVPEQLEWDGLDSIATHILVWHSDQKNSRAVATARILKTGKIGRMAVYSEFRGMGIGTQILSFIVEWATINRYKKVYLHAQEHALGFYQKAGFKPYGDLFEEAGIVHQAMEIDLH